MSLFHSGYVIVAAIESQCVENSGGRVETPTVMRRLSSEFTFFFKVVVPGLWITLGLFGLWIAVAHRASPNAWSYVLFCVAWLSINFLIDYWNTFPLKKVSIDDKVLRVSNFVTEVVVPLSNVEGIEESRFVSWWRWPPARVIVHLKSQSEFGRKIIFVPGYYIGRVADDLRTALNQQEKH